MHAALALPALLLALSGGPGGVAQLMGEQRWSEPAPLGACPARSAPAIAFPSDGPTAATGPGAVVWEAAAGCPGGAGLRVSPIGAGDVPQTPAIPRAPGGAGLALHGAPAVTGGPGGRIVIAGQTLAAPATGAIIQGRAGRPFASVARVPETRPPIALSSSYLDDAAFAAPGPGAGPSLGLERHYQSAFSVPRRLGSPGAGPVRDPTLALDYRSDVLAVWRANGGLYARLLSNSGALRPLQRLAHVGPQTGVSALLSDDGRAIVAWSETLAGSTSVFLDRSRAGVRFSSPSLLERYADPVGQAPPAASPELVRLASESVMLAWAGRASGAWVIRTATVDENGVGAAGTIGAPEGDALLDGLAATPDGGALALWSEPLTPSPGAQGSAEDMLLAARGEDVAPTQTRFAAPEAIAGPGPASGATIAADPASGRALAVWRGPGGLLQYSIRSAPAPG